MEQKGPTAIEYGLIAAVVGISIVAGLTFLKNEAVKWFADKPAVEEQVKEAAK